MGVAVAGYEGRRAQSLRLSPGVHGRGGREGEPRLDPQKPSQGCAGGSPGWETTGSSRRGHLGPSGWCVVRGMTSWKSNWTLR